jgi:hypothetical protein
MKYRSLTLSSLNVQNINGRSGAKLYRSDSDLGLYTALSIQVLNYDMSFRYSMILVFAYT